MNKTNNTNPPPNSRQEHFESKKYGNLTFFPQKKNQCSKCLLYNELDECLMAPCTPFERLDNKEGYFSNHNIPEA